MAPSSSIELRALTLNVWGLWLVSKKREERIGHLCNYLRDHGHDHDIVLLQEVWVDSDTKALAQSASEGGLGHSVHFKSGTFGSGLLTLSRHPIVASSFHRYSGAGDALVVICGDYLAAKGYGWVRVRVQGAHLVDVFNTHTHANYSHETTTLTTPRLVADNVKSNGPTKTQKEEAKADVGARTPVVDVPEDKYAAYRMSQMWELANGIVLRHQCRMPHGSNSNGVLVGGDLNSKPDSLEMALLLTFLRSNGIELSDAWTAIRHLAGARTKQVPSIVQSGKKNKALRGRRGHKMDPEGNQSAIDPNEVGAGVGGGKEVKEGVKELEGITCMSPECSFKSTRQVPERIDYLLSTLQASSCVVTLKSVPSSNGSHLSYSDHFAVQATYALPNITEGKNVRVVKEVKPPPSPSSDQGQSHEEVRMILEAARGVIERGANRCKRLGSSAIRGAVIALLVVIISLGTALSPIDLGYCHPGDPQEGIKSLLSTVLLQGKCNQTHLLLPVGTVAWMGAFGSLVLALISVLFSALAAVLVLKSFLVDTSQGRALELMATEMSRAEGRSPLP